MTRRDSGTGAITKRGDRRWMLRIELGRDGLTGERRRHHETVRGTKREAQQRLAELERQLQSGFGELPGKVTTGDYLARWLSDYAQQKVSARTLAGYRQTVAVFGEQLGPILLRDLRPDQIQSVLAGYIDGGRSGRTAQKHYTVLKGALKRAVQLGLVGRNPAEAVERPRASSYEMHTLSPEAIQRVLGTCEDLNFARLIYFAIQTGMRAGEILGLRWRDVSWETGQIQVQRASNAYEKSGFSEPKARSRRSIAASNGTLDALREHRVAQNEHRLSLGDVWQDADLVFPHQDGRLETVNELSKRWAALRSQLGLEGLRFHDLRHTSATLALEAGVHPKVVQERLGHSTISVTLDTYSHVLPNMQREAAEALDSMVSRPMARNAAG